MVTDQELQQEKEKAINILSQPTPERKFGVTVESRDLIKQRRRIAQSNLKKIQEYEAQKQLYEQQLEQQQLSEQQRQEQLQQLALEEKAMKLIFRGKVYAAQGDPKLMSKIKELQRKGFRSAGEIQAQRRIIESQSSFGYIPVAPEGFEGVSTTEGYAIEKLGTGERFYLDPVSTQEGVVFETRTPIQQQKIEIYPDKVLTEVTPPTDFLGKLKYKIESKQQYYKTQSARGEGIPLAEFGLGIGSSIVGSAVFVKDFVFSPVKTAKSTGEAFFSAGKKVISGEGFPEVGQILRDEPYFSTGFLLGEYATYRGTTAAIKYSQKGYKLGRARISTKYKPFDSETGLIDDIKLSSEIDILPGNVEASLVDVKKLNLGTKEFNIKVGGLNREIKLERPSVQLKKYEGKDLIGTSAQTDFAEQILNREMFFDPQGRLRPSRFQDLPEASLVDVLAGDFKIKFKEPTYQALVLQKPAVKYPSDISKAIKSGKGLTPSQLKRYQKIRNTANQQFKVSPKLSVEPEVILSPGEEIYFKKKVGKTIINKKPIDIIEIDVKKPTAKYKPEKIKLEPINDLKSFKYISSESDLISYSTRYSKPSISLRRLGSSVLSLRGRSRGGSSSPGILRTPSSLKQIKYLTSYKLPSATSKKFSLRGYSSKTKANSYKSPVSIRPPSVSLYLDYNYPKPKIKKYIKGFTDSELFKKGKRKTSKFKEDILLTEGFTSKVLGITRIIPKEKLLKIATEPLESIGLRGRPILR